MLTLVSFKVSIKNPYAPQVRFNSVIHRCPPHQSQCRIPTLELVCEEAGSSSECGFIGSPIQRLAWFDLVRQGGPSAAASIKVDPRVFKGKPGVYTSGFIFECNVYVNCSWYLNVYHIISFINITISCKNLRNVLTPAMFVCMHKERVYSNVMGWVIKVCIPIERLYNLGNNKYITRFIGQKAHLVISPIHAVLRWQRL